MIQMIYSKHTIHNNINCNSWGTLHHQLHIKFENICFDISQRFFYINSSIMLLIIYSKHTIHNNIRVKYLETLYHQLHIKF